MKIKNLKINKKLMSLVLAGSLLLTQVPAFADMHIKGDMVTTKDTVNMRLDNSKESDRLGKLGNGVTVKRILSTDDGWDLVVKDNQLAFVMHEFVNDGDETLYGENVEYRAELVCTSDVKMRLGPGEEYDKVGSVKQGTIIKTVAQIGDWYIVNNNGKLGFCKVEYFKVPTEEDYYTDGNYHYIGNTQDLFIHSVRCIDSTVNVRSDPDSKSDKLGYLVHDQQVEYTGIKEGEFYQVIYQNQIAYVHEDYVVEDVMLNNNYANILGTVYCTGDINLRADPSMNDNVIGTIEKNCVMEVIADCGDFYMIKTSDYVGYVSKSVVKNTDRKFVYVDISHQEVRLYQDNKVIFYSPICTGTNGNPTDEGVFTMRGVYQNATLKGPGYETHVDVFMKYNGGEGLHDLKMKYYGIPGQNHDSGSHGCDRMPHDNAIKLSTMVEKGVQVIVGNGHKCNGKVIYNDYSYMLQDNNGYTR